MRQLSYTGPDQLRCRLKDLSTKDLVAEAAAMRPRVTGDPVAYATKTALASLGRRVQALDEEASHLDETLAELVMTTAPNMLELFGVGFDTAAVLLVAAGDNPERLRSEAAWAHMCGVWRPSRPPRAKSPVIASTVVREPQRQPGPVAHRHDPPLVRPRTGEYMERRTKEGRSKREVIRI